MLRKLPRRHARDPRVRGWTDPENRISISQSSPVTVGQAYQLNFDMQPKDSVIAAGRRLGVMIISSDNEYTVRPAAGTQLSVNLAKSSVQVPILGGAKALAQAMGITAPEVGYTLDPSAPNGQSGWYTSDVSLDWTVNDGGAPATTNGCADTTYTTDGQFNSSCTASNMGGMGGPVTVSVRRDATAPTATVTGVRDGATYVVGSVPGAACDTRDATSGVAAPATLTLSGGTIVGRFTATCAGGRDVAGNISSASSTAAYNVMYAWSGFLSPSVNPPAWNRVKQGKSAVLKFALGANYGLGIISGTPQSRAINCSTGRRHGCLDAGAGSSSLAYSASAGQYTYTWETSKSWKGTCREFLLTLNDGTVHTARFRVDG